MTDLRAFRAKLFQRVGKLIMYAAPVIALGALVTNQWSWANVGICFAAFMGGVGLRCLGWILEKTGH